ncbi:plasmid maintenance protein CcdB [Psychrosphaera saromensis]|uniref:Toxin CcdB n=1 Tax=Psychrosphaera saromensis TaxID=716813 RepID=A0A2S7URV0_9GAMM|nr:CcdB family protein [Psychrosphaera saromensis]PQJ52673.1 plasmid maintenance protein CcdB [Psychrosphaera saromensis]GHB70395.1 plasmid maintenance protein CcdB [Psychrosphaera saromensis]GLQ13157.1 plasmid maintenance protein CcdB [Psychrosphaera saromensis]
MAQFSLYINKDKSSSRAYPYLIDVQSDLLSGLESRMVIPLTPLALLDTKAPTHLCPVIQLEEGSFVILTQQMTSVPTKVLKEEVRDLSTFRNEIIAALDFLITGI